MCKYTTVSYFFVQKSIDQSLTKCNYSVNQLNLIPFMMPHRTRRLGFYGIFLDILSEFPYASQKFWSQWRKDDLIIQCSSLCCNHKVDATAYES